MVDDVSTVLTGVEVVLRAFIQERLRANLGSEWLDQTRVPEGRRREWARRREQDQERRDGARVPESLLDYSDLSDLAAIIDANWSTFSDAFHDQDETRALLRKLAELRNPEKHARGLLDFERAFILAISGQLRNQIVAYRSEQSSEREYFPSIEFVRDSFGNIADPSRDLIETGLTLRPGDEVRFECSGRDPEGVHLRWLFCIAVDTFSPQREAAGDGFTWEVQEQDIAERRTVRVFLLGDRPHHRHGYYDDDVDFVYRVLPPDSASGSVGS